MHTAGDPELKVYGIFGYPLAHTVSPAIQNSAFDHYGLKSFYFAFERPPARFRFLMRHLKSLLLEGFNVTVPYKETVVSYLDRLSPEARMIGAVNTVKKEKGKWAGYNTDVHGFLVGLKEAKFQTRGKKALILGAGGSARAVAYALAKSGIRELAIANRTQNRAKALVQKMKTLFPKLKCSGVRLNTKEFKIIFSQVHLLVNATKVGLKKTDRPLVVRGLFPKKKILVYDLIYNPRQTELLRVAKSLGHKIQNGETMLLHQGSKAFEIWTGKRAPIQHMRKALHDALHSQ